MKKIKKMFNRFMPTLELYTLVFVMIALVSTVLFGTFYLNGLILRFLGFDL